MKDRLLQILSEEKMTSMKFAEIMEVRPSNISHILSGRNNPGFDFIARLLRRFPNISPDWLLNGEGDMYRNLADNNPLNSPIKDNNSNAFSDSSSATTLFGQIEAPAAIDLNKSDEITAEPHQTQNILPENPTMPIPASSMLAADLLNPISKVDPSAGLPNILPENPTTIQQRDNVVMQDSVEQNISQQGDNHSKPQTSRESPLNLSEPSVNPTSTPDDQQTYESPQKQEQLPQDNLHMQHAIAQAVAKTPSKIILLYNNNTFDIYDNNSR